MNDRISTPAPFLISLVVALLVGSLVLGCETPWRATPFPPDLTYLPPEQIRSSMWVLAAEVQDLERLLSAPHDVESPTLRTRVRTALERMQVAARALDRAGRSTQHPALNQNLSRFLHRLETAERAVDRDPPSYFQASTIAGSCFLCHGRSQQAMAPARSFPNP